MRIMENGLLTPEYLAECKRVNQLKIERRRHQPFEVGKTYRTNAGAEVTCIELSGSPGYEVARFSDGGEVVIEGKPYKTGYRYNRDSIDRGRVTGSPFDHSHPDCVIPELA